MSFLELKQSAEVYWTLYVEYKLPFLGYDFESRTASDILATRASKRPDKVERSLPGFPG